MPFVWLDGDCLDDQGKVCVHVSRLPLIGDYGRGSVVGERCPTCKAEWLTIGDELRGPFVAAPAFKPAPHDIATTAAKAAGPSAYINRMHAKTQELTNWSQSAKTEWFK